VTAQTLQTLGVVGAVAVAVVVVALAQEVPEVRRGNPHHPKRTPACCNICRRHHRRPTGCDNDIEAQALEQVPAAAEVSGQESRMRNRLCQIRKHHNCRKSRKYHSQAN
jgi:hypothetical protein